MHVIPPYEAGVTLYRLNGTSQFFASRRLLVRALGMSVIRHSVGPRLDEELGWHYVIRDELGQPLFARDFELPSPDVPLYLVFRPALLNWNGTGPVPGTGRRRGGNAYRLPKTMRDRRDSEGILPEEGEPQPRPARRGRRLPTSWDDMARSDYGVRSWKQYRKTQWKPQR